jgi:hypothetical protein
MSSSEWDDILAGLSDQGWILENPEAQNYRAIPPDKAKPIVFFHTTSVRENRALPNAIAQLRRSGFVWPPPPPPAKPKANGTNGVHATPAPPEPTETDEERVNRLFESLKEARTLFTLMEEAVRQKTGDYEAARRAKEEADRDLELAREHLASAKRTFDEAFGGAP